MSGGRSREAQCGDISAVDPLGAPLLRLFVIECKTRKTTCSLTDCIYGSKSSELISWWEKLCSEAEQFNRLPMLVLKENRRSTLFFVNQHGTSYLSSLVPVVVFTRLGAYGYMMQELLAGNPKVFDRVAQVREVLTC